MNGSVLSIFSDKGTLIAKDVTPWQTFSGKGMKFQLQSFDWAGCAYVSHLTMRVFLGLMKMETVICTPYTKDLPLFSYDLINAIGKRTLLVELYDTQLEPIDLSPMQSVKESYRDLKEKSMKPHWYDTLRLSPSTCKVGSASRLSSLATEMTTTYTDLFATARTIDPVAKTARNSAYVEGIIRNGGPAINTIRQMLGSEAAEILFRRFLFGTER